MSINSEKAVIGALMLDAQSLYKIQEPLKPVDFQNRENRLAYATACKLIKNGEPVDVFTLEAAGGGSLDYLGRLAFDTPGSYNIDAYARAVKQAARKRQLMLSLKNGLAQLEDGQPLEEIRQCIMTAIESEARRVEKLFADVIGDTLDTIKQQCQAGSLQGLSTGLAMLDRLTGGFHGPKMIVLGGRPGTYKSAYAMQVAVEAAAIGKPVGVISLEMSRDELAVRAMANSLRLDGAELSRGDPHTLLTAEVARRWKWPLFMCDDIFSWPDIVSRIIGWKHQHDIQLAVIDYLQIIQVTGKASRFEKLSDVSRECKLLAQRLGIPILLLVQLSRAVEQEKRCPVLSDIRECGNLEQDADIVLFLHNKREDNLPDEKQLILAKQRAGPARKVVRLQINGPSYHIGELSNQSP